MRRLASYLAGEWHEGEGDPARLVNPATEVVLAETTTGGLDFCAMARFGREIGGPALRALSFGERAEMLRALSKALHAGREELLDLATANGGNTRGDGKFDVDGATATLSIYADLGAKLGDARLLADGEGLRLARNARYWGQHVLVPREGVAVLINAFNFPAWGFAEKAACALLAGVPVIVKPATSTALLTWRMIELAVESGALPAGAMQFVAGSLGDLFDHLEEQDVVAFTGSADTARRIRAHENLCARSITVNVEADSLNAAVLAPGLDPEGDTRRLFIRDVLREMTQKAGQKCTAVRRILVPTEDVAQVRDELAAELEAIRVGDPADKSVRMGPLTTAGQLQDAREGIAALAAEARLVTGGADPVGETGYFVAPTLLECEAPDAARLVHDREVFGPVATILPYDGTPEGAAALVSRGRGCLVSSAYGDDRAWLAGAVTALAPWNGRLYLGSKKIADAAFGSGMALPVLLHGGPGRAGGGQELGGLSGLRLYQQRCALQGDRGIIAGLLPKESE